VAEGGGGGAAAKDGAAGGGGEDAVVRGGVAEGGADAVVKGGWPGAARGPEGRPEAEASAEAVAWAHRAAQASARELTAAAAIDVRRSRPGGKGWGTGAGIDRIGGDLRGPLPVLKGTATGSDGDRYQF
jgi:hypothetical protein